MEELPQERFSIALSAAAAYEALPASTPSIT